MPDRRRHRGPHPRDESLFGPAAVPVLQRAVSELSWLLTRGYAVGSALVLVGNRYQLSERQRTAVLRCSSSDAAMARRLRSLAGPARMRRAELLLDGYNVLTTIEAALAGGFLIRGREGALRDMASMHGTWRAVDETLPALEIAARCAVLAEVRRCTWYLDRPVSNSGRLRSRILETAERLGVDWEVHLVADPDPVLAKAPGLVATADSAILDRCVQWVNFTALAVALLVPDARVLDLGGGG